MLLDLQSHFLKQSSVPHAGILGPFAAAEVALHVLHTLARLQPAVDLATGQTLQPLPQAHRAIASPEVLPHIAQASQFCGYGPDGISRVHKLWPHECLTALIKHHLQGGLLCWAQ